MPLRPVTSHNPFKYGRRSRPLSRHRLSHNQNNNKNASSPTSAASRHSPETFAPQQLPLLQTNSLPDTPDKSPPTFITQKETRHWRPFRLCHGRKKTWRNADTEFCTFFALVLTFKRNSGFTEKLGPQVSLFWWWIRQQHTELYQKGKHFGFSLTEKFRQSSGFWRLGLSATCCCCCLVVDWCVYWIEW